MHGPLPPLPICACGPGPIAAAALVQRSTSRSASHRLPGFPCLSCLVSRRRRLGASRHRKTWSLASWEPLDEPDLGAGHSVAKRAQSQTVRRRAVPCSQPIQATHHRRPTSSERPPSKDRLLPRTYTSASPRPQRKGAGTVDQDVAVIAPFGPRRQVRETVDLDGA